jgi:DNA-binding CsgD family transcriptional regulator
MTTPELQPNLTRRERRVLMYLAAGCTVDAVADAFERSPHTIKTQSDRIRRKLGARNQAHMVAIAYESGLLQPGALDRVDAVMSASACGA